MRRKNSETFQFWHIFRYDLHQLQNYLISDEKPLYLNFLASISVIRRAQYRKMLN
jgi:hypothetical protein